SDESNQPNQRSQRSADQPTPESDPQPQRCLCPEDSQAVDDLLAASCNEPVAGKLSQTSQAQRSPRHACIARLLDLLACCPADPPPSDLQARTMHRLAQVQSAEQETSVLATLGGGGTPFRWTEILVTAASVMIAFALL